MILIILQQFGDGIGDYQTMLPDMRKVEHIYDTISEAEPLPPQSSSICNKSRCWWQSTYISAKTVRIGKRIARWDLHQSARSADAGPQQPNWKDEPFLSSLLFKVDLQNKDIDKPM